MAASHSRFLYSRILVPRYISRRRAPSPGINGLSLFRRFSSCLPLRTSPRWIFDGIAFFSVKMESLLGYRAFFPMHSDPVGNDGEAFIGSGLSHFPQRHSAVSSSSHIYEAVVVLRLVVISYYGWVFLSYADYILSDMGEILAFSWLWSNRGLEGR